MPTLARAQAAAHSLYKAKVLAIQVFLKEEHLVIIMEYAAGGPVLGRVADGSWPGSWPFPEGLAKRLYRQLVSVMEYCHKQVSVNAARLAMHARPYGSMLCNMHAGFAM